MAVLKCSKCGRELDITGQAPGASLTCACGNAVTVPRPTARRTWLYVILGVLGVALLCPCLSVFVLPWTGGNKTRARQSECKANLKAWYISQIAIMQEKDRYMTSIASVGFAPERGNRYAYFSGTGPLEDRSAAKAVGTEQAQGVDVDTFRHPTTHVSYHQLPERVRHQLGISGQCPQCSITLACMGQIDDDATLDVWTISTADRKDVEGRPVDRGTPLLEVNDDEL